jgi:hypothetical protein
MKSAAAILEEINRITAADRAYNRLQNEGCEGYERETNTDALYEQYKAARDTEFRAKWTKEYAEKAKAVWNKAVSECSNKAIKSQGQLIAAVEKMSGYKMDDMKRANEIHR